MVSPLQLVTAAAVGIAASLAGGEAREKEAEKSGAEKKWSFDGDSAGALPRGFSKEAGEWKVAADASAPSKENVLAQTARSAGAVFNLVLVNDTSFKDVELTVRMRPLAGETDQGGGLVWRAKDGKNYYIARYNPLEDNYRVYKVVDGKRTQLASSDARNVGGWRSLKVTMQGDRIACYLDGKKLLEAKDATFPEAGKIGLWTKADAQTHFDDLSAAPLEKEEKK